MARARNDAEKKERRQAILLAALDAFYLHGFAAARMDDIARDAGVAKGALYLYFQSKEELFEGLIELIAAPKIAEADALAAAAPSALAGLRALLTLAPVVLRETAVPKLAKVVIASAAAFPAMAERYRTLVVDRGLAVVESLLARGREEGAFAFDDLASTARLVVAPLAFSLVWITTFEREDAPPLDVAALLCAHERMLLRALGAEPEEAS